MATNEEDNEFDVGEISGGEEPEIEFTDDDIFRRLPSEEAPPLVGAGGGGGSGGIDPLDEDSDESRAQSVLSDTHGGYPGECDTACLNEYNIMCECNCERCMFKYRNSRPPNERRFKTVLRRNFRKTTSWYLIDPQQRSNRRWRPLDAAERHVTQFRARRPYDYTQESDTQPCTQLIPWGTGIRKWNKPCPNHHRREQGQYHGRILPCDEVFCTRDLDALDQKYEDKYEEGLPGDLWNQIQFSPPDGPIRPYVCEEHIQDSKDYFCMGENADNLHNAHLIRFCKVHEAELQEAHSEEGKTTCTCRNVDFTKWQCRSCFQTKVEKLQRNFRRRVNAPLRGGADEAITDAKFYQRDWKGVRRMLQRLHPCLKGHCGRPRLKGLVRNEVLDCRCCGGFIVQPLRRSTRLAKREVVTYEEGNSRGSSAESSTGSGERDCSPWQ